MKKRFFLVLGILLIAFISGFLTWTMAAASEYLAVVPYTAVDRMSDGKTGKQLVLVTTIVRSDGSMVQKTSDQIHAIWNVTERTEITIDPVSESYVVAPLVGSRIPTFTKKLSDCESYFRGRSTRNVRCTPTDVQMFGNPVTRVDITVNAPNPRSYSEVMYAIQRLGWLIAKKQVFNEKGELLTVNELIDLREGEPSAAEFSLPAGMHVKPNFVEYHKAVSIARSQPVTPMDIEHMTNKWQHLINKARAEGDNRFN